MSLLFMESCDHHGTSDTSLRTTQQRKWGDTGGSQLTNIVAGRFSVGYAVAFGTSNDKLVTPRITDTPETIIGFSIQRNAFSGSTPAFLRAQDAGAAQVSFHIDPSGVLYATRDSTVIARGKTNLRSGKWFQLEIRIVINPTVGEIEVRLNEYSEINLTGLNTRAAASSNSNMNEWEFHGQTGATGFYVDDIWYMDTAGSFNNTFIGDVGIEAIFADSNGTTNDWTVSGAGSNYLAINENPADDDTTYVTTLTPADLELYNYSALTRLTTDIRGVQSCILQKKTNIGARSIAEVTRVSATNYVGTSHFVTDDYQYTLDIIEEDPNTATQWTESGINGAEFGFKIIS